MSELSAGKRDRRAIATTDAPAPGGAYSQGIVAGGWIFVAGQVPINPATGELVEGGIAEQTKQVFFNIQAILAAAGAGLEDVVRVSAHLQNLDDFDEYDTAYHEFFEADPPARITVGSDLAGFLIEVEAQALLP